MSLEHTLTQTFRTIYFKPDLITKIKSISSKMFGESYFYPKSPSPIDHDVIFVDMPISGVIIDSKLRAYKIDWQVKTKYQEVRLENQTFTLSFTTSQQTNNNNYQYPQQATFQFPGVALQERYAELHLIITPIYDMKCETHAICAQGVIMCDQCKEVIKI